jgi:hypothetical protein
MNTFVKLTVLAVLMGVAGAAHAAELVSPTLPTHVRETNITTYGACWVFNSGTGPVAVTVSVFANNGVVTDIDTCSGQPLAGGRTCLVTAYLPDDSYAACEVAASNVSKLRGTFELSQVDNFYRVFLAEDLR